MLLLIAIGGALGSVARYLSSAAINNIVKNINSDVQSFWHKSPFFLSYFPYSTLFVNVTGSMLAGVIYFFCINSANFNDNLRNFLIVGFLGGFTTFSAFSLDFFRLFSAQQYLQALIYALASVTLAIGAIFLGYFIMKFLFA